MKCVFRAISYEYYGVSNHRLLDSFFKSLFKHMEETNQSPASLALCEGIPRVIGPPQRANIAESCSCHDVIWYGTTLVWVTDGPSVQRIFPLMQVYMLSKINGLRKAARVIDIVCSFVLVKAKWWWYSNNNDNMIIILIMKIIMIMIMTTSITIIIVMIISTLIVILSLSTLVYKYRHQWYMYNL